MSRNKYPEETVTLILDVAQKLFIEKGYEHTTVQDIIDNLGGLTKGAIYHHFKSKEEILNAVCNRLFANNSLSAKWQSIQKDITLNGAEKLQQMFIEAINDEQEQEFRKMGIHFQNMPQMLSDLLLRNVNDIAINAFLPVIEEGITDGSIHTSYPKQLSEMIALIANVWISPLVFPVSNEEMKEKFEFASNLMKTVGVDISDIFPALDDMNKELNN